MRRISKDQVTCYLSLEAFDQVSDGHSRRHCVRVDDYVWSQTFTGKWHVFLKIRNKSNNVIEKEIKNFSLFFGKKTNLLTFQFKSL